MRMGKKHNKLTAEERENLVIWLHQGKSKREIARRLGRSDSTVRDELKRNSLGIQYIAVYAQRKAEKRVVRSRVRHPLKNKSVYSYVLKKLRCGWSPEQISGRLKLKKPKSSHWKIHHETIYRFIYAEENKEKRLWEYLPRKQKRRRKKTGRSCQKVRIPDRVSIHLRPEEVENRQIFGHWEGDSIVGKNHHGGLHTQIERKTRYTMAGLISSFRAEETAQKAAEMFDELPEQAKKSTTVDNGKEFTNHKNFGLSVFFADPYSSWQRGTNENTNGLIRRYLPKKTDLTKVTAEELDDIIQEINDRPRKCLGFYNPREMFENELLAIGARIPTRM